MPTDFWLRLHVPKRWPQFAYLQSRGTDAALLRLATHCRQVRDMINQYRFPIHHLPGEVGGGLTVSLDLSKAFDMVGCAQLLEGLKNLHISSELLHFLSNIYQSTSFQFLAQGRIKTLFNNPWHPSRLPSCSLPVGCICSHTIAGHCLRHGPAMGIRLHYNVRRRPLPA